MTTSEQQAVPVAHFYPDAAAKLGKLLTGSNVVADDARTLVIAAREFWDPREDGSPESRALLAALEAFSSRVPYEDEPAALGESASLPCKSGEGAEPVGYRWRFKETAIAGDFWKYGAEWPLKGAPETIDWDRCEKIVEPLYASPDATQTREAEGSVWRAMDSAPKHGVEFQAWVTSAGLPAGWWEPRCRYSLETEVFEIWGRIDYDEDGFGTFAHANPVAWTPQPLAYVVTPALNARGGA